MIVATTSDYQRYFQPFHVRQDVIVAPINRFIQDPIALEVAAALIENALSNPDPYLPPTSTCPVKQSNSSH